MKPEPRRVLHGDWGWFLETKNKAVFKFIRYTWRHRIRLWIGIDGNMGGGEYTFKRVKFRGRLHRLLNRVLSAKTLPTKRTVRFHTPCPVRKGDRVWIRGQWVYIRNKGMI